MRIYSRAIAAVLAFSAALLLLAGCGGGKPKGTPVSIEFGTQSSGENGGGGILYLLALPEGGILGEDSAELTVRSNHGAGGYEYNCTLSGDVLTQAGDVIDGNGILNWNGFDKTKNKKETDSSFTLTVVYPDGSRIAAYGSNAFPRGWDKGSQALNSFFEGLLDEEALSSASGDRMSQDVNQGIPEDGGQSTQPKDMLSYSLLGDSSASVTRYNGSAPDGVVVIPDEFDGHIVASLGNNAFEKSDVVSVSMGSYVNRFGESCFEGCADLTGIQLPSELSSVPRRAFADCVSLRSAVMPAMVQFIEPQAFEGCTALTEVGLNEGLISIGSQVFSGCSSLSELTIPYSVNYIGEDAFEGCSDKLTLKVYPDSYGLEYAREHNINYIENSISG